MFSVPVMDDHTRELTVPVGGNFLETLLLTDPLLKHVNLCRRRWSDNFFDNGVQLLSCQQDDPTKLLLIYERERNGKKQNVRQHRYSDVYTLTEAGRTAQEGLKSGLPDKDVVRILLYCNGEGNCQRKCASSSDDGFGKCVEGMSMSRKGSI